MSETRDPGRDEDPPGTPPGPGDHPELGSPDWRLVPCSPDWLDHEAYAQDDHPGDLEEYDDPDNAPPPGLDDDQLAADRRGPGDLRGPGPGRAP